MLLYVALVALLLIFLAAIIHPLSLLLTALPLNTTGLLNFLYGAKNFVADLLFWAVLVAVLIMALIIAKERLTKKRAIARTNRGHAAVQIGSTPGRMAVALTAYNDAESIGKAVEEFKPQPGVAEVIAIDNNSRDNTSAVAAAAGARVVREQLQGYGYACMRGLQEALKNKDADVIVLTEGDGTFAGKDLAKFQAYIQQADMVMGTRTAPGLVEEDSQMDSFFTWGNLVAGILLQLKFWDWRFLGTARLTDVGCTFRVIRRQALERILPDLSVGGNHFSPHMTLVALDHGLSIVEIPVTFRRRIGKSKGASQSFRAGFKVGLAMLWHILLYRPRNGSYAERA